VTISNYLRAMPPNHPAPGRRLADLLVDPHETLEVELKEWLDIVGNNEHKATLAKGIIALANHGGGFIIIGFTETDQGVIPAVNRPANLAAYTPDTVNSVVLAYAEPSFHCDVNIVGAADGVQYPVISIPGGHRAPIKAKRDGPNGQIVSQNFYYIRRPGPQSEPPQNGGEWDVLIRRCISNARDDLLNQIRSVLSGAAGGEPPPDELDVTTRWLDSSIARWQEVIEGLADESPARFANGHFAVAYQLIGNLDELRGRQLLEAIDHGTVRHTGWPEFWVPTRDGIQPYVANGNIECWIARDGRETSTAHSDFWRVSRQGQLFLIRGHQEDGVQDRGIAPGTQFDITLPTWRVGEALLHASNMAAQFGDPQARVVMIVEWTGLDGRRLFHLEGRRLMFGDRTAHQNQLRTSLTVQADQINDALPELVGKLISPLYELFDFFVLPPQLVVEELTRMRANRF
jgi:hypothetical protein